MDEKNLLSQFSRALVLAPHTDDEMGCAGSIARLIESGCEVKYIAFSKCIESVPVGLPLDILVHEAQECTKRLGIPRENFHIEDIPVRHFPHHRQTILERLVSIGKAYRPDVVLLPAFDDIHQDHHTIAEEGLRAFKHATVLGYELPQNSRNFKNTCYIRLQQSHLQQKIHALQAYESQKHRIYSSVEFIESLARIRGAQCNTQYAEAFDVIRAIF